VFLIKEGSFAILAGKLAASRSETQAISYVLFNEFVERQLCLGVRVSLWWTVFDWSASSGVELVCCTSRLH
jgi:hypothetical protein